MKKNWPEKIRKSIEEAVANYRRLSGPELSERLAQLAELVTETIAGGHRVYFCGNGGSAADAQHLAAEFVGRFRMERRGLPAVSLTTDTSVITAVGNDYGFDQVFSRQVEALGRPGDLLFVFSTSGNSDNLLAAVRQARTQGLRTAALLGKDGGRLKEEVDVFLLAPGGSTDRIQEVHILVGHLVAGLAETELAGRKAEPPRRRTREKVVTLARLMSFLKKHRGRQKVVFTNGCFDIIHDGHRHLLEAARAEGDLLVVGLNSDDSVRRLKGPDRPLNNQGERARMLASLEAVDRVVIFEEDTPMKLIRTIRPDVLVKGGDYRLDQVVGRETVESYGGRVALVSLVPDRSTTRIIEKVRRG